jgi:hypothetical protein
MIKPPLFEEWMWKIWIPDGFHVRVWFAIKPTEERLNALHKALTNGFRAISFEDVQNNLEAAAIESDRIAAAEILNLNLCGKVLYYEW